MVLIRKKIDVNKEYIKWCKEIARTNNEDELISHFRTHVDKHFIRHKNEGKIGRLIWLIAVFNFANIFKEKFKEKYKINTGDMLFECCVYLKEHRRGPVPSFDVDKFIKKYKSEVKNYYYRPARVKKWQLEK